MNALRESWEIIGSRKFFFYQEDWRRWENFNWLHVQDIVARKTLKVKMSHKHSTEKCSNMDRLTDAGRCWSILVKITIQAFH